MDEYSEYFISATSKWSLTYAVALHIYHCCIFKLSIEDMFHHGIFLPTIGIPGMIYDWGCFGNWLVFFMCGLPGGVDYLLLGLHKLECCLNYNQKRICANINVWFRMPAVLFGVGVAYALFVRNTYTVPTLALLMQLIFLTFNVVYYTKQSVINYTLHSVKTIVPHAEWNVLKKIK